MNKTKHITYKRGSTAEGRAPKAKGERVAKVLGWVKNKN